MKQCVLAIIFSNSFTYNQTERIKKEVICVQILLDIHLTEQGGGGGGSGGARWCWVNFQCRGVLPFFIIVGQGPTALTVGAGGGCLDIFDLVYRLFSLSLSLGDGPI